MRLLFIQHGDFDDAYARLRAGGPETYGHQRHSVDFAAGLAGRFQVTVMSPTETARETAVAPGLDFVGFERARFYNAPAMIARLRALKPDLAVLRTPHPQALMWLVLARVPTLPTFADLFAEPGDWKARARRLMLARLLRARTLPCVANHALNASRSLVDVMGLAPGRVVPWDWPPLAVAGPPKAAPSSTPSAFFAGAISGAKGVGDVLEAMARLKARGVVLAVAFAGSGDVEGWRARAEALGIGAQATFLGRIPVAEVRERMAAADLVLVPSRPAYAEGLPITINEGLASRSPVVLSDHPAFVGRLRDGAEATFFRACDPEALAEAVRATLEPDTYARLSANAEGALAKLTFGTDWSALVARFLDDPLDRTGWVAPLSLTHWEGEARAA